MTFDDGGGKSTRYGLLIMHLRILPVFVALIAAISMVVLAKMLPAMPLSIPYRRVAILIIGISGIAVAAMGVVSFRRNETTVNPVRPSTASSLVVDGVYGVTRNPMYLGIVLLLIAWGVYLEHVAALVAMPAAFIVYMNNYQIIPEEQALMELFGDEFAAYQNRVRRWI